MSGPPSPLGRYDGEPGGEPTDEQLHEVRLVGVPVQILVAGREHHDELMREFALLALGSDSSRSHLPRRLVELTEILGVRYGRAVGRPSEEIEAAVEAGQSTIDLTYQVPAHIVEAAETLDVLMREADVFCHSEQLLTLKRSELIAEFSDWYLAEFRRQVEGLPPTPWTGPLQP